MPNGYGSDKIWLLIDGPLFKYLENLNCSVVIKSEIIYDTICEVEPFATSLPIKETIWRRERWSNRTQHQRALMGKKAKYFTGWKSENGSKVPELNTNRDF